MADENSNAPQDDDSTKRETIRITLPPKTDQPAVKRETVRINVPGATDAPKKETSKITLPGSGLTPPPPPPATPPTKPISSITSAPKPPPLTGKPTVPLKPAPPAPSPSGSQPPPPSGIVAKPVSPKKETARITLPSEAPKASAPALPKATVKMQQTQPLSKGPGPASGVRSQPLSSVSQVTVASGTATSSGKPDTATLVLSIVAFLAAAGAAFMAFNVWSHAEKEQHQWTNHMPYVK